MARKIEAKPKRTPKTLAPSPPALPDAPVRQPANPFPIVGIGASAGGLGAFEAFFSGMPAKADPGMAFVLVQHLAPNHKSLLTELIRRYTRMDVFEVRDGMVVQPNCAYIIPPGRDMAFLNGTLQLLEPAAPRGQRLPIDFFFRSLAQDQRERAIGIVLSGTGSDGTLGLRAIKGEGGMAMAQTPESTEFAGMPQSALATGLVDFVLPPTEMAAQLMAYAAHAFGQPFTRSTSIPSPKLENALKKIFILLRSQTGHDFSQYKPSTIHRRIERRMAVHQIDAVETYVSYLQQAPVEVEALFRDLLIGVTNFFRDPAAFQALEDLALPSLFADRPVGSVIRVWCAGCSTGEEAYSLAILLQERMEAMKQRFTLQVFATDIDSRAVAAARAGLYPASIAVDLSPERLARFFVPEPGGGGYRIHKGIRDTVVFSEQNVIKDPPFSRLDLVCCRNLMIYLGSDLQKKLLPLFHYALNPGGMLFLGTSETVGEHTDLFGVVDRQAKLYQRKEDARSSRRAAFGPFSPPMTAIHASLPQAAGKTAYPVRNQLRDLTEHALLQKATPPGALVNSQGDILYLHGRTGTFLELAAGEVGLPNILKMAREGLRRELVTALHTAAGTSEPVSRPGLQVRTNGHFTRVNLSIHPLAGRGSKLAPGSLEADLFLIVLEETGAPVLAGPEPAPGTPDPASLSGGDITALKQELRIKEEYLQTANEQLETSNEELKSSNEEMQSVNEELQSTNEELETSKEELQSVNEELATVNGELQTKVVDLSRASNDMNNLLAGTGIGTVFVDLHLRILRFTPTASAIINLIPNDVGRPVAHLVSNLVGCDTMIADAQAVLDSLIPREAEVQTKDGRWFTMRIQPYRTLDNVIEGAVITFVDITERRQAREELQKANQKIQTMVESITDGLLVLDHAWVYTYFSEMGAKILGMRREELIGKCVWDLFPLAKDSKFSENFRQAVQTGLPNHFEEYYPGPLNKWLECRCYPSADGLSVYFHDITERKRTEEALKEANDLLRLAVVVRDAHDAITVQDLEGRTLAWNPGAERLYGWTEAEALAMNVRDRIPKELQKGALATLAQLSRAEILAPYLTQRLTKDGASLAVSIISTALLRESGELYAIATTERPAPSAAPTP